MREEPGELAGRENASSCLSDSFPTRNKILNISELDHHDICNTNTEKASQNNERLRERQGHGENWDQELKNREGKMRLQGGRRGQSTHHPGLGQRRNDLQQRWKKHGSGKSCQQGGRG